jgi:hypothetical protein
MNKRTIDLTIISMMAVAAGHNNCYWRGDCEIGELYGGIMESEIEWGKKNTAIDRETNSAIFRMFNRVDEEDVAFLEKIGYDLPSLSVGDLIVYEGKAFKVMVNGFKTVKEQAYTTMFSR